MLLETTNGVIFEIDDSDFQIVSKHRWTANNRGYIFGRVNGKNRQLSRFIVDCPEGFEVDHIDFNNLNNKRSNLRMCTHGQNEYHTRSSISSSSKYKGVSLDKKTLKWTCAIKYNKNLLHLGTFNDEIDAAIEYDNFAKLFHGAYWVPNVLSEEWV